jgi:hypothetical protein
MEMEEWKFESESTKGKVYTVIKANGGFECDCPAFIYSEDKNCRHIKLVENGLAGKTAVKEPELCQANVRRVLIQGHKVLIPFIRPGNEHLMYRVVYDLRKLGISKRKCQQVFGKRLKSDTEIEGLVAKFEGMRRGRKVPVFTMAGGFR